MGEPRRHEAILNLPNSLTFLRLLSVPVVVICLYLPGRWGSFLAAFLVGAAFATDFLDGFLARKYQAVTVLGKLLDPLADKILVCVTLIALVSFGRIPAWMVMFVIAREIAVTGLRGIAAAEGLVIQASVLGKYKTVFQAVAVSSLCLHYEYFTIDFHEVGLVLFWIALMFTVWSGWAYFTGFRRVFSPVRRP
ncbi:MAG: CDP-diacylglycerol--glycerol-3-phosphate 3-phosphatidyltransferase [Deltaproteobacteria bacterium]|nr:CDP-diacylglycerol--glycerol-3-phosphate 3-phosphatidyltransferase [Deltaproteobacteria bacterium]